MRILYIPFIPSDLCRITLHSVLGMIRGKTSEWLGGLIHSPPSSTPLQSYMLPRSPDLQGSLWCGGGAGRLRNMNCGLLWLFKAPSVRTHRPVCLGLLHKIYYRTTSVFFHLVFYGLCPQRGAARTKQRQTPPFPVLY